MNFKRALSALSPLLFISRARPSLAAGEQQPLGNSKDISSSFSGFEDDVVYSNNMTRAPVICVSHGGGPMPLLDDPDHKAIVKSLRTRVPDILRLNTPSQPRAIVLVTAHWSTKVPTISSGKHHDLYYDYGGFPPETYNLKYDAPGSPEIADEIAVALDKEGFESVLDDKRGWDHGVFVPMMLINEKADIPIVQMSVLKSENPLDHFKVGKALSALRDQNIAIVGSGFASLHNLRAMFSGALTMNGFKGKNEEWSKTVTEAVLQEKAEERQKMMEGWRMFPSSYEMHPKGGAEHFLPLIVAAGAAGEGKGKCYSDEFMGLQMWSYYWQ